MPEIIIRHFLCSTHNIKLITDKIKKLVKEKLIEEKITKSFKYIYTILLNSITINVKKKKKLYYKSFESINSFLIDRNQENCEEYI
jgi:hypothetical protein